MKTLVSCALALVAAPALAGTHIQMESTDLVSKTTTEVEMLIDATRLRVNTAKNSMIFLTSDGRSRMLMLDKVRNEYSEMDQAAIDRMGQQMQGMASQMEAMLKNVPPEQRAMMEQMMKGQMPQAAAPQASARTVYAAAGSDTVNGVSCTKYLGMKGGQKVSEVCAAGPAAIKLGPQDYQVFEKMREFMSGLMDAVQKMPMAQMVESSVSDPGFEGFPVRRVRYSNGAAVEREQLKAIKSAGFTDADFTTGAARKVQGP